MRVTISNPLQFLEIDLKYNEYMFGFALVRKTNCILGILIFHFPPEYNFINRGKRHNEPNSCATSAKGFGKEDTPLETWKDPR